MDKQREKLIELIGKGSIKFYNGIVKNGFMGYLADHLLANGVIVPPCKVGDEVYSVCFDENYEKYIVKGRVCDIIQGRRNLWVTAKDSDGFGCDKHKSSDFGKTVFLSKEDAEKALKNGGQLICSDL